MFFCVVERTIKHFYTRIRKHELHTSHSENAYAFMIQHLQ